MPHVADDGVRDQRDTEEDDECPRAAEAGDVVSDALAEGLALVDEFVGVAAGAAADHALGDMDFAGHHGEHVQPGLRLAGQQHGDVVAVDLDAGGVLGGNGGGLMRYAFEHGGEAEEVSVLGLGEDDLLAVFVDERDLNRAGEHDVGRAVGLADLVDALVGREGAQLDLLGEDVQLVVIEQREERDLAEFVGVAGHRGDQ